MAINIVPIQFVVTLIDLAEEAGVNKKKLLRGTRVGSYGLSKIDSYVDSTDFFTLVNRSLLLTNDSALGLKLGQRLNISSLSFLGQVLINTRTLEDFTSTLNYIQTFEAILNPWHGKIVNEHYTLFPGTQEEVKSENFIYEMIFTLITNCLKTLFYKEELNLEIVLPYKQPEHHKLYNSIFGKNVSFSGSQAHYSFHKSYLEKPIPTHNKRLLEAYIKKCFLFQLEFSAESISQRTLTILRKVEGFVPNSKQMSSLLRLSERTYSRRLSQENTNYQTLLDTVRMETATDLLNNSNLPISSIAYQLGFQNSSNFRKAYRRWTQ